MKYRLFSIFILVSGGLVLIGALAVNAGKPSSRDGLIEEYVPIVLRQPPASVSELYKKNTPTEDLRVIGVITSLVEQPLYNISVLVRAYDLDKQLIATYTVTTIFTATIFGQGNVFDFTSDVQEPADFTAEVVAWEDASSVLYAPVSILEVDTFPIAEGQFITATLRNDGQQALYNIIGLFWHETELFSIEPEFITAALEPGEIYVYTTFAHISPWVEPNIIIQGRVNP